MKDIFSNIEQQIENIDAKIEDIVKNAADAKTYDKLNQQINEMVNSSIGVFERGYERAEKVVKEQSEKIKTSYELQQENLKKHSGQVNKSAGQPVKTKQETNRINPQQQALFAKKDGVYGGGLAMAIVGYIFVGLLGIAILVMLILNLAVPVGIFAAINRFVLLPLLIIFLIMGISGSRMVGRVNRYKKYIQFLGGKMTGQVSDFANNIGKSDVYVQKDLQKMINSSWFRQGRLTRDKETLIVNRDAYAEYELAQQLEFERAQTKEAHRQMQEQLPAQARQAIQKGQDYLKAIHEKKVAISDYDMTVKLTELENILKKIFKRVETHPEVVTQMRKMMDYYLPTTVKLLDAYVQLDKQTIEGVNIVAAKSEIEESLDTLITAYEKLLDDLFQDVMLDVSTDIAVLNTMLAQDGLTANGFDNMTMTSAEALKEDQIQ